MIFQQLFEPESSTYTYLLADEQTREAVLIDSVLDTVERDFKLLQDLHLKLIYVLDTHIHADHITGAGELRQKTGAKTGVSALAGVRCADLELKDGDILPVGNFAVKILATPGHTDSCVSFLVGDKVFTGDCLLINSNGRTDFQQGSPQKLYHSITEKLFTLPEETVLYPGHDYKGETSSSIGREKKLNPRIGGGKSLEQFSQFMSELKLSLPKKINQAVPSNLICGRKDLPVPEISPEAVRGRLDSAQLIDVRTPEEFQGELGHVAGARLLPLGAELGQFLMAADRSHELILICRGGSRSAVATAQAQALGYKKSASMSGGMTAWTKLGFPVQK